MIRQPKFTPEQRDTAIRFLASSPHWEPFVEEVELFQDDMMLSVFNADNDKDRYEARGRWLGAKWCIKEIPEMAARSRTKRKGE